MARKSAAPSSAPFVVRAPPSSRRVVFGTQNQSKTFAAEGFPYVESVHGKYPSNIEGGHYGTPSPSS